jgi:hypothetical protein
MAYDHLIFDTVNVAYMVFFHPEHMKENKAEVIEIQGKKVYKNFFRNFIERVEVLKNLYLNENGTITFLYDNYTSREELNAMLKPLKEHENRRKVNKDYKSTRVNQKYEFYSTLDALRYYYLVQTDQYHTVRIPNLEGDDLVSPCINKLGGRALLVSNDLDWCRSLSDSVHTLPDLFSSPLDPSGFLVKYGYDATEGKVILNKILWGDTSDDIPAVFPDFSPDLKRYIVDIFYDVQDFMLNAHKYTLTQPHVQTIKDRESDIRLSFQMLSSIPVSCKHFDAVFTTGRNSTTMLANIHRKIYGEEIETFKFGLTIPRLDP